MAHTANHSSTYVSGGRKQICATARGVVIGLVLCVVAPWLAACSDPPEHPDYLSHPYGMGEVWAVDGDRFYVVSGGAVVLWLDGVPAEVIYSPPDRDANDTDGWVRQLWGAQGELTALSTSLELRVRDGSEFHAAPETPGQRPVFFVRDEDLWGVARLDGDDPFHWLNRIYRLHGGDWSPEADIDENFVATTIRGDTDTGLWAAGNGQHLFDQGIWDKPILVRRDQDGWETMDSTYFGYVSSSECADSQCFLCSDDFLRCVGDVSWVTGMWVDLSGRAHVVHKGPGILVHDGTQSWMEESPAAEPYRIDRVEMAPDGTVYANATVQDSDVDPAFLWIHDGTGWQGTELWSSLYVQGLSAFDGGAVMTACGGGCYPVRVWPDGTWIAH